MNRETEFLGWEVAKELPKHFFPCVGELMILAESTIRHTWCAIFMT